jgi:hypothetical protein
MEMKFYILVLFLLLLGFGGVDGGDEALFVVVQQLGHVKQHSG